jgi:hypothetical protein
MSSTFGWEAKGSSSPAWHRVVYLVAAAPLLLFALWGWEHGAHITFGIPALICMGLAIRPARLGATILFWPFAAGACLYGWLLVKDVMGFVFGDAPEVLLNTVDSAVFVVVELTLLAVSVLLFVMSGPPIPRTREK